MNSMTGVRSRTWTDEQLKHAVEASSSWRGVLRALGLNGTSAAAIRLVRHHVVRLELDVSHFRGRRRWSDAQLKHAVAESQSWDEVLEALGLATTSGNARTQVKGHVIRLGLDFSHLGPREPPAPAPLQVTPDLAHLREAGPSIAAAWFALRGCGVLFPVEPAVYDLVVSMPEGLRRIQVKTTTSKSASGWQVGISRRPHSVDKGGPRVPYDPDAIDYFFIVDGDLALYLIPSRVIAGRVGLGLRTYRKYIVGGVGGLRGRERSTGMADVGVWLSEVGAALDVPAEVVLPEDVQAEMLDLTGDIAHAVVRYAVPLTSYLMGVAVGRGASPQEALRIVAGLLPPAQE